MCNVLLSFFNWSKHIWMGEKSQQPYDLLIVELIDVVWD